LPFALTLLFLGRVNSAIAATLLYMLRCGYAFRPASATPER